MKLKVLMVESCESRCDWLDSDMTMMGGSCDRFHVIR